MLGIPGEKRSKYGAFYDSAVLMPSVSSTSGRRQDTTEKSRFRFSDPVSELYGQSNEASSVTIGNAGNREQMVAGRRLANRSPRPQRLRWVWDVTREMALLAEAVERQTTVSTAESNMAHSFK
jgi:hypothetical protein